MVVNYLPVGSEEATKWYTEQILTAGCAMVNCMPVFIAREDYWQDRFRKAGVPVIGDDIKSQVGATIVHRVLTRLFQDRGVRIENTYQLNFGGNTDFLNMLERERLISKKISKTNSVRSQLDQKLDDRNIHIGPSDYVRWLDDRKWCYIRMEGRVLRRHPDQPGAEAGGGRLAQQRGHRHRRGALLQAGPRPRALRDPGGAVLLLHEVAATPVLRQPRQGAHRGLHRRDAPGRRAMGTPSPRPRKAMVAKHASEAPVS